MSVRPAGQAGYAYFGEQGRTTANCNPLRAGSGDVDRQRGLAVAAESQRLVLPQSAGESGPYLGWSIGPYAVLAPLGSWINASGAGREVDLRPDVRHRVENVEKGLNRVVAYGFGDLARQVLSPPRLSRNFRVLIRGAGPSFGLLILAGLASLLARGLPLPFGRHAWETIA